MLGSAAVRAQSGSRPADEPGPPAAGFWPTPRMIDLFLERGADDIARRYELSDEQYDALLTDMQKRWPAFMEKHRATLQPLISEVFEMRLAGETPSPEKAAEWARRAIPILEEARRNMDEGSAAFSKVLNAEQRNRLQREMTEFNVGYTFIMTRAKAWRDGQFNAGEWPPDRGPRRREADRDRRAAQRDRRRTPPAATQPLAATPQSAWRRYVERFASTYELDDSQRKAAESILKDMERRAEPLLKDYDSLLTKLEKAVGDDREQAMKKRRSLDADLERRFDELKRRLNALLTAAQRTRGTLDADVNVGGGPPR